MTKSLGASFSRLAFVLAAVLALAASAPACSEEVKEGGADDLGSVGGDVGTGTATSDDDVVSGADSIITLPDGATVEGPADATTTTAPDPDAATAGDADTASDAAGPVDTEAPFCGAVGCGCATADDCDSGLCVDTADGRRCTELCIDSCTQAEFDCRVLDQGTVDPVSACLPSYLHLCEPCQGDASCQYRGGERCIPAPHPEDGSFCTTPCDADGACPDGYRCAQLPFGGATEAHCVPTDGTCDCRPAWADDGLVTDCETTNAFGTCPGTRTCGVDGLTECTGAPSAEVCNGVDDDCDGVTDDIGDDVACEVANQFGTCPGTLACEGGAPVCHGPSAFPEACDLVDSDCDGQTDEGTCDDGVACTVDSCVGVGRCAHELAADRCLIDGVCVAAGAANPSGACERCVPSASTTAWTATTEGFPADQCVVDPCAGGGPIDPAECCSVGLACADDDHLVTSFSCAAPGGSQNRVVEFYGDLCCYDASEEHLYCTAYGDWSAGSGRDTDPSHNPALVAVTSTRSTCRRLAKFHRPTTSASSLRASCGGRNTPAPFNLRMSASVASRFRPRTSAGTNDLHASSRSPSSIPSSSMRRAQSTSSSARAAPSTRSRAPSASRARSSMAASSARSTTSRSRPASAGGAPS